MAAIFCLLNHLQIRLSLPVDLLFIFLIVARLSLGQKFLSLDYELLVRLRAQELERHFGALTELGLTSDDAVEALCDLLANAETQPVTLRVHSRRLRVTRPEKWLKKLVLVVVVNPYPIVLDADQCLVEAELLVQHALDLHDDYRVFRAKFDRVRQEVYYYLLGAVQVHPDDQLERQWLQLDIYVLRLGLLVHDHHNVADHPINGAVLVVRLESVILKQTLVEHQLNLR